MVCLALLNKTRQEQELQVELVHSQTNKGRQYPSHGEPLKIDFSVRQHHAMLPKDSSPASS